jgi:predicted NBD/HSP70 family sugar kinase
VWLTILNARGERLLTKEMRCGPYDGDWDGFLARALAFASDAAEPLGLPVLGVGFGVPGWVDVSASRVVDSFQFGLHNLHPLAGWSDRIPLVWENDANCGAWSCQAPGDVVTDALYVFGRYLEVGVLGMRNELAVGFGLVIAGRLHRGWRHRAGEYRSALWEPGHHTVFGVSDQVFSTSHDDREAFQAVARDLARNLRSAAELLDPRTIFLGGDLKFRYDDLRQAMASIGWPVAVGLLTPLAPAQDEVSLGAAQLVLDELFQLPSSHKHSLLGGYGTGTNDPLWRGLPVAEVRRFSAGER